MGTFSFGLAVELPRAAADSRWGNVMFEQGFDGMPRLDEYGVAIERRFGDGEDDLPDEPTFELLPLPPDLGTAAPNSSTPSVPWCFSATSRSPNGSDRMMPKATALARRKSSERLTRRARARGA